MKPLRDDPIEEGIDAFFEEKQKLEDEIRDYEQKYLDQYYDQLYEQELSERLEFYDDLWSGAYFSDKETHPDKPLIDVTMEPR